MQFYFSLVRSPGVSFLPGSESIKYIFSARFAVSLVFVMYAYSGWNAEIYMADEIKNPRENLPGSLILGTLLVVLLYVPLNLAFFHSSPLSALEGKPEVGFIAANHIFGSAGAVLMGSLISLGLISSINSMIWAGPRVSQAMGEDYRLLGFLQKKNRNGIPVYGLLLQYVLVIFLVLTAQFEQIIVYIGFIPSLSSFLTVTGVFMLRWKSPDLERPYRTWGYPITPIIYLAVTGRMMVFVLRDKPVESIAGLITLMGGLVLYRIDRKIDPGKEVETSPVEAVSY